jgi:cytochrome c oxidase subunit 4
MNSTDHPTDQHLVPYGTYFLVWGALLILTALTVAAAGIHFGRLNVLAALLIASCKTGLVLYIFMHLKYDEPIYRNVLFIAAVCLAIFIGITFLDVSFR